MKIDKVLLDELTQQAQNSPRLRMNFDLRTSSQDHSQRMLNAVEPGTVVPIHRHMMSTEVVILLRGKVRQNIYDENGCLTQSEICEAGGDNFGFSVPVGVWHNMESLESGTVFMDCKDGAYAPLTEDDVMTIPKVI
ncbi:MAG: WbuC family cupin fold metalloprotein [Paludibacteraceae bacterium]|nr:WbuC family cupin fold metalloprotein [Paludibacteraceae bacterium]